ncbi:MAG: DUF4340 domain-containing protein [Synechococcales bacterium]|nr:DUF4340 domain-containing protein [Cyanobacteria bacterium REEB444]MEB3126460.1 DUF4340 domain-containing protein [Synechococcales bacterium]
MKFQRTTVIMVISAFLITGLVYVVEVRERGKSTTESAALQVFKFKETDVQSFMITIQDQRLEFFRSPQPPSPSIIASPQPNLPPVKWQMKSPQPGPANDGTVDYLLSLLTTTQRDRTLTIPSEQKAEFGLAQPKAVLDLTLVNQKTHRLVLGNSDFNQTNLYALIDPSQTAEKMITVVLLPMSFSTAVVRPLMDWQPPRTTSTP